MAQNPVFVTPAPQPHQQSLMQSIREQAQAQAELIEEHVPDSREKYLALTHLELAKFYANQAVLVRGE